MIGEQMAARTAKFVCLGSSRGILAFVIAAVAAVNVRAHDGAEPDSVKPATEETAVTNAFCPVLPGRKVNAEISIDYRGKHVYFCCLACKAEFEKNPQKYLAHLPQLGGTESSSHAHGGVNLGRFIVPMGIVTLTLLITTVAAGLFRRRRPSFLLKWHKRLGIATLICALIHFSLVLIAH